MKITVKYKEIEVEFDSNHFDDWKDHSKRLLQQLKEIYKDDSEFEKF